MITNDATSAKRDYTEFVQALSMLLENNELANIFSVCRARPLITGGETGCSELPRKSNANGSELTSPIINEEMSGGHILNLVPDFGL